MDRRCPFMLLSLLVIAACAPDRPPASSSSDEGVDESTSGELTDVPGEPPCNATYCTNICALQIGECDEPYVGTCVSDIECACEPPICVPCIEEACGPYASCWDEWGECHLDCSGTLGSPSWEEVGCSLPLPDDLPDPFWPYLLVWWFNGDDVPFTEDCARLPEGWTLSAEQDAILLCELSCAEFEAGLALSYGWGSHCP